MCIAFDRRMCFVDQSRDCAQLGPPPQGEEVQVRWTDGLVYGAKFVAVHVIQMYQVSFFLLCQIKVSFYFFQLITCF